MLRAMIVDDEAPARSELKYLLDETGRVDSVVEAS
ncbi:MAG: LytR/AlgR family response regulator transcription factor, partial [Olsenella sp.]